MIKHALKEWQIVCDLVAKGELPFLLRKGGLIEDAGPGAFRLKFNRFAFFPSWEHQQTIMLKEKHHAAMQQQAEPDEVPIAVIGEVKHYWIVDSREKFDQLDHMHCWSENQINMRFNYKPEMPLFLLAIRPYRLPLIKTIESKLHYGGCKSWIEFDEEDYIDSTSKKSIIPDLAYAAKISEISKALGEPQTVEVPV